MAIQLNLVAFALGWIILSSGREFPHIKQRIYLLFIGYNCCMDSSSWLAPSTIVATVSVIVAFVGIWWKINHDKKQRQYDRQREFRRAQREAVVKYITEINEAHLKFSTQLHLGFLVSDYSTDSRLPYSLVKDINFTSLYGIGLSPDVVKSVGSQFIAINNELIRDIENAYYELLIGVYEPNIANNALFLFNKIPRFALSDFDRFTVQVTTFEEIEEEVNRLKNKMFRQLSADTHNYLPDLPKEMPSEIRRLLDLLSAPVHGRRKARLSVKAARGIRKRYCLLDSQKQKDVRTEFKDRFASELKDPCLSPAEVEAGMTYKKVIALMNDLQSTEIKQLDADLKRLQRKS